MAKVNIFLFGTAAGILFYAALTHIFPEHTLLYYEGWQAGREFCKATDETPINQPMPLAETLRRKK